MTMIRVILAMLAALAAAGPAMAQDQEVVVRGETPRAEIERILNADNLDTSRLSPRDLAGIMAAIPRGHAPEDFWAAYQAHVEAWARLADVTDQAQQPHAESAFAGAQDALAGAAAAIGTTFEEVERIARLYHARLPAPLVDPRTIA